jgi:DeoR/GlpR family transcriptional regulator of sugar metabolism
VISAVRKANILSYIRDRDICSVQELSDRFSVSRVTVYRILHELEQEKMVTKIRGGVQIAETSSFEKRFNIRLNTNQKAKEEIAKRAVTYIAGGDSIFIDGSTTGYYLAEELAKKQSMHLIVISNGPSLINVFAQSTNIDLILTGGEYQQNWNTLSGTVALDAIKKLQFDMAFITAGGVSLEQGIMTSLSFQLEISTAVINSAKEVNLILDSSKFSKVAPLTIAPISRVRRIISDSGLSSDIVKRFHEAGIEIQT